MVKKNKSTLSGVKNSLVDGGYSGEKFATEICLVPNYDGALHDDKSLYKDLPSKEILWDNYYMVAPRRQRQFVLASKIVKRA